MSKYTVQLRYLVENGYDIGLNDYPIFNEDYRETLNDNIINHFYFREIGFETAGEFAFRMKAQMQLIMPYYNKLYEHNLELSPFVTHDMTETYKEDTASDTKNEYNAHVVNDGSTESIFNDTPQGVLEPDQVRNMKYATNVTFDDNNSLTRTDSTTNTDYDKGVTGERHNKGFAGVSSAELFKQFRNALLNIDQMVIDNLETLFLMIW